MLKIFEPITMNLKQEKPQRPSQTHVVQPGETFGSIASMYGMHVMDIRVLNNMYTSNLHPGTTVFVQYKPQRSHSLPLCLQRESMENLKVDETNLSPQPEQEEEVELEEEENVQKPIRWWYKATKRMHFKKNKELQPQSVKEQGFLIKKKKKNNQKTNNRRSQSERFPIVQEKEKEVSILPHLIGGVFHDVLSNPEYTTHIVPQLEACLPMRCRGYDWQVLYSSNQHGSCIQTLLCRVKDYRSTLIIIKTCDNEILGGFASSPWMNTLSYYGTGESFVFSATPKFEMYSWKRSNSMMMFSNDQSIAMGGGGGGFAWYLNTDLSRGTTASAETFMNRRLASTPEFDVASVEVWGFVL